MKVRKRAGVAPKGMSDEERQEEDDGGNHDEQRVEQVGTAETVVADGSFGGDEHHAKDKAQARPHEEEEGRDGHGKESEGAMPLGTALRMKGMSSRAFTTQTANGGVAIMDKAKPQRKPAKTSAIATVPPRRSTPRRCSVDVSISSRRPVRAVAGAVCRAAREGRSAGPLPAGGCRRPLLTHSSIEAAARGIVSNSTASKTLKTSSSEIASAGGQPFDEGSVCSPDV